MWGIAELEVAGSGTRSWPSCPRLRPHARSCDPAAHRGTLAPLPPRARVSHDVPVTCRRAALALCNTAPAGDCRLCEGCPPRGKVRVDQLIQLFVLKNEKNLERDRRAPVRSRDRHSRISRESCAVLSAHTNASTWSCLTTGGPAQQCHAHCYSMATYAPLAHLTSGRTRIASGSTRRR